MTTFDDDAMRLHLDIIGEAPLVPLHKFGFEWPPPEYLFLGEKGELREATPDEIETEVTGLMVRTNYSQITDAMRAEMTHMFRGAEYHYARAVVQD